MMEILSVENMRKSDAAAISSGISGKELMYRAGKALYEAVMWKSPVGIVCGVGNNAGDGYVLANILSQKGIDCTIILLEERFSADGKYYLDRCMGTDLIKVKNIDELESLSGFAMLADCILGTGYRGEIKGKIKEAIDKINNSGAYVIAVDINSGLNGDSGITSNNGLGCVVSDLTVSIGSFKPGHFLNMAKDVMKEKINCDIGIRPIRKPYYLLREEDIKPYFSERPNYSNKGTFGYTAIIGGSKKYSGAVRLAAMANAAMRTGAGVVKVGIPSSLYHDLLPLILESTVFPLLDRDGEIVFNEEEIKNLTSNVKTVAFGMGIGTGSEIAESLGYLLREYEGTLIVDADGLTVLSRMEKEKVRSAKCKVVMTPHIKEFERLTGLSKDEVLSAPIHHAETYALDMGTIVLLKGPSTIVTDGVRTYIVDAGCPGMATAGSGDVLSGILSAVCAYMPDNISFAKKSSITDLTMAVAVGAYINGKAGELAQERMNSISMIAGDTVSCIPESISNLITR